MAKIVEFITINVAVKDLDTAVARYKAMGLPAHVPMHMPEPPASITDVTFPMGKEGSVSIIAATDDKSPVARFIEKRGEGVQHMGVEVDDLDAFVAHAESLGARISAKRTIEGIRKECLVSPKSAFGIILQPIEWLGELKNEPHHERIVKAGGL